MFQFSFFVLEKGFCALGWSWEILGFYFFPFFTFVYFLGVPLVYHIVHTMRFLSGSTLKKGRGRIAMYVRDGFIDQFTPFKNVLPARFPES